MHIFEVIFVCVCDVWVSLSLVLVVVSQSFGGSGILMKIDIDRVLSAPD